MSIKNPAAFDLTTCAGEILRRWFASNLVGLLTVLGLLIAPGQRLVAQAPPSLYASAPTYSSTNHYVATTVFNWFLANGGQVSGPWLPLEGRTNWTGQPDWWQGQIKQMMMANIDVIYVHMYQDPSIDPARVNFFTALSQLRAQGYDTPKVAPFVDPQINWGAAPIDLATTPGKDAFANEYIRFYNQYYTANTDAYADDYLARQANKPILDIWSVINACQNVASLSRSDVSTRLVSALGASHPCFTNGFVMVTPALMDPRLAGAQNLTFADEKVPQFETNGYHVAFLYNGIISMQLKAGYWDQNIRTNGTFLPRAGGLNYSNAWTYPDRNTVKRVYVESWNEYDEGTGIYAGTNAAPYIAPANTFGNTDTWSVTGDPFEYIKTTARGAAIFNDTPAQDARILWHNFPATLTLGESRTVTVIVRNAGDASWTAAASYKFGQVDADATAFVSGKRVLINDSQDEIPLYGGIFRGRAKSFTFTLTAPASLGTYTNHFQMLQEGAAWFGDTLTNVVTVKTKSAATLTLTNLAQTYDGTAKSATAVTTPAGLTVNLSYNGLPYPPSAIGSYSVVGIINNADYYGTVTNTLVITSNPNLMWANGSFETTALGAAISAPAGANVVDGSTIAGWRVFNVDAGVSLSAVIVSNASAGSRALQFSVTNTSGTASYGLDQWGYGMQTPIQQGANYVLSLDLAWVAGNTNNRVVIQVNEFDASGNYLKSDLLANLISITSPSFATFSYAWKATHASCARIGVNIVPMYAGVGTTTLNLDNVRLMTAPLMPNGSFEYSPIGTQLAETSFAVDTTTFMGWRLFNTGIPGFTGTIVDAGGYSGGTPGSHAMRLDINNTNSSASDYGLDTDNNRPVVTKGKKYTLSFDLEGDGITGGALTLTASILEWKTSTATLPLASTNFVIAIPMDQKFHHYSMDYIMSGVLTTNVSIAFRPTNPGFISALVLDNVSLAPYAVTANPVTVYRAAGSATQVKKAKIMSYEPLGLIFVTNSASTALGAGLTADADTIYVPVGSVDDSFTYFVTDGDGYTNSGTVFVKVGAPTGLAAAAWPNGDFSANTIGTASGIAAPSGGVDATTFANWRFYSVGSTPVVNFAAMIQDASVTDGGTRTIQGGVPGSHCIRLDVNNPANQVYPNAIYALDRDNAKIPVTYGVAYTLCFEAALYGVTGSPFTMGIAVPEFNAGDTFDGSQTGFTPSLDGGYRAFAYSWTPLNPATTQIAPTFTPYSPGFACAVGLANVSLHAPVASNLITNRASGTALDLRVADLMAAATDDQNHPLTFVGTSVTTTNGSVLSNNGLYITVSANTVADQFTYQITDGLGATNFATVSISVTQSINPNPTNMVFTVSGGNTLNLTWPGSHLGWYVESNSVGLNNPNGWFPVPGSQLVTNLNITIDTSKNVFYRMSH